MNHVNFSEVTNKHFSRLAQKYGVNEKSNADKYLHINKILLPSQKASKVLECGGGAGYYTQKLLMDGYNVTCIDLSSEALSINRKLAKARGKARQLRTIAADFIKIRNGHIGHRYDQILFIKVLHHFDSLEKIYAAIELAVKLCRRNGRIIIFEPNGRNILWEIFFKLKKDNESKRNLWFYEKNLKLTTVKNFENFLNKKMIPHRIRYHYIIPAFLLNRFRNIKLVNELNSIL